MFDPFVHEDATLDEAIASAFAHLAHLDPDSDAYQKTLNQVSALYALKTQHAQLSLQAQQSHAAHQLECDKNAWQEEKDELPFYRRIDPNTALTVLGNAAIALIVIKYEQTGVISSKVFSFMQKI